MELAYVLLMQPVRAKRVVSVHVYMLCFFPVFPSKHYAKLSVTQEKRPCVGVVRGTGTCLRSRKAVLFSMRMLCKPVSVEHSLFGKMDRKFI